ADHEQRYRGLSSQTFGLLGTQEKHTQQCYSSKKDSATVRQSGGAVNLKRPSPLQLESERRRTSVSLELWRFDQKNRVAFRVENPGVCSPGLRIGFGHELDALRLEVLRQRHHVAHVERNRLRFA